MNVSSWGSWRQALCEGVPHAAADRTRHDERVRDRVRHTTSVPFFLREFDLPAYRRSLDQLRTDRTLRTTSDRQRPGEP